MAEHEYDDLARDLAALGRAVDVPAPGPGLATAVLERLSDAPAGRRVARHARPRRRLVALAVGAVLLALLATPPVRAAVADWFGFGGVRVERGDARHRRPTRRRPRWHQASSAAGGRGDGGLHRVGPRGARVTPTASRSRPTAGWSR